VARLNDNAQGSLFNEVVTIHPVIGHRALHSDH